MPSLLTNLSLGIGGLAVTGGVGYSVYELTRDKTQSIIDLLKKNNKVLLGAETGDEALWAKNWEKYIDNNSTTSTASKKTPKTTDTWGLSDWSTVNNKQTPTPATFKAKCGEKSKLKVLDEKDDNYKEVLTYCTKESNA